MYYETDEWVRIRNLRISIAKGLLSENWNIERGFSESELNSVFRFKSCDLAYYSTYFFNKSDERYTLTDKEMTYIKNIISSNKIAEAFLQDADARFISEFGGFYNEYVSNYRDFPFGRYKKIEKSLMEIIPVLHWGHLPIFNKYLLHNREINPEEDTLEFYCHYDCMKAMLDEIEGVGQMMSIKSDDTLGKNLTFEVYTRRWGHSDIYRMQRTIDGWICNHIAINGECQKSGEGALFNNLDHDSIFYPKDAIMFALENLWESAEEGEIDLVELQKRLQQVADWISSVEKAVGENQPEWVNYY